MHKHIGEQRGGHSEEVHWVVRYCFSLRAIGCVTHSERQHWVTNSMIVNFKKLSSCFVHLCSCTAMTGLRCRRQWLIGSKGSLLTETGNFLSGYGNEKLHRSSGTNPKWKAALLSFNGLTIQCQCLCEDKHSRDKTIKLGTRLWWDNQTFKQIISVFTQWINGLRAYPKQELEALLRRQMAPNRSSIRRQKPHTIPRTT